MPGEGVSYWTPPNSEWETMMPSGPGWAARYAAPSRAGDGSAPAGAGTWAAWAAGPARARPRASAEPVSAAAPRTRVVLMVSFPLRNGKAVRADPLLFLDSEGSGRDAAGAPARAVSSRGSESAPTVAGQRRTWTG